MSMSDITKRMKEVNVVGLRDPNTPLSERKLPTEDGKMSMYDAMQAYSKVQGFVAESNQDKKDEALKNLILEDKDRLRVLGALQLVKEMVDRDLMKVEKPGEILENVHKIIETFYS